PKQRVKQFDLKMDNSPSIQNNYQIHFKENSLKTPNKKLINETISYYQTAADLLKNKEYQNTL
ncbi:MAG: hypothetical protein ACRC6O_11315, partial [Flavobacterium sp.]